MGQELKSVGDIDDATTSCEVQALAVVGFPLSGWIAARGEECWRFETGDWGYLLGGSDRAVVYVGSDGGYIYAITEG